jgi:D-alanyl-D-alanine carboxypeptidase
MINHMRRRDFLKIAVVSMMLNPVPDAFAIAPDSKKRNSSHGSSDIVALDTAVTDHGVKDRLIKSRFFNHTFQDDILLPPKDLILLKTSLARLYRIQKVIGYGNFSLLNFDDAVIYARSYSRIGRFSREELLFLEKIFYDQVKKYGFMGEKTIETITGKINKKDVKKIPSTGNYLYRGKPIEIYHAIQKKIGPDVVLTSGVRSVMKQFLLFLNKTSASQGNLSMASRSLAPPGYSYHGVGDFDVGKKGFGVANFTEQFTQTQVYKKLADLGYISFRYEQGNDLGVRFEPWHIEVV